MSRTVVSTPIVAIRGDETIGWPGSSGPDPSSRNAAEQAEIQTEPRTTPPALGL